MVFQHGQNGVRVQRWFVVAIYDLGSRENIHELQQRRLEILYGSRGNWLDHGKFREFVNARKELFFVRGEHVYM